MAANWNTVHLAAGAPEPDVDPNVITVYNMRLGGGVIIPDDETVICCCSET